MRKYALVKNNFIVEIKNLTEEDYIESVSKYQMIVDIEDVIPQPQVEWSFNGVSFVDVRPLPSKHIAIYDYMAGKYTTDYSRPPIDVDYITNLKLKLHRKSTLNKGECINEVFYEQCNGTTYSIPVVREDHTFTRDGNGFAIKRETTISWYMTDGTLHPETKALNKFYSFAEQIDEGKTRRGNLINALQMSVIGLISLAMTGSPVPTLSILILGRAFTYDYKLEFDAYTGESNKSILACLSDPENPKYVSVERHPWIDSMTPYGVTIRNYLIAQLSI